eukprot:846821-Amorphochlora_amoeboformis.AAC.2
MSNPNSQVAAHSVLGPDVGRGGIRKGHAGRNCQMKDQTGGSQKFSADQKSAVPLGPMLGNRWVLAHLAGSLREAGGVNPLKMAHTICGRMARVLLAAGRSALNGEKAAIDFIQKSTKFDLKAARAELSRTRDKSGEAICSKMLHRYFGDYMQTLHDRTQMLYDSEQYQNVKWINCLPTFQTRFGVSVFRIAPFVAQLDNLDTLKSLYMYFYFLYLDAHYSERYADRWAKLFPNRARVVKERGLDLTNMDTYEDFMR